jgi:small subunit ribosomal protein S2
MSEQNKEGVLPAAVSAETKDAMQEVVRSSTEPIISMKKLAAAGVQYGHQMRKWNPKMAKFIYTSDRGIYIVDLKKTVTKIEEAYVKLKEIITNKGTVLFVGTKKQIQSVIKEEALRSGSFYINTRWLGGTLTNFRTILARIRYLKDLEQQEANGTLDLLPKKEAGGLRKQKEKLLKNLEGIKEIRGLPKAVFVVDPTVDHNAVAEARKLNIPVFAITDTNCDPDLVDYPIPGNDDAIGSVRLIVQTIADAIVEAKGGVTIVAYTKDDEFIAKIAALKEATKPQDRSYGPRSDYRSHNSYGSGSSSSYHARSTSTSTPSSTPQPVVQPTNNVTPTPAAAPVVAQPAPVKTAPVTTTEPTVEKKPRAPRKPKIEAKEE